MKRKILTGSLLLIIAIAALSIAETKPVNPNKIKQEMNALQFEKMRLNSDEKIDKLSLDYKLWVDAHMTGDRDECNQIENSIFERISVDISACELEVRELAKDALMSDNNHQTDKMDKFQNPVNHDDYKFESALQFLNTKESIYRTMNKSNGFSIKYRLLGDYIDLLRRELKMPRLKLASTPPTEKVMPR